MQNEQPEGQAPADTAPAPAAQPPTTPTEPAPQAPAPDQGANWQFHGDEATDSGQPAPAAQAGPVSWTASEFIEHSKNAGWYLALAGGTILLTALIYLLTKDKISAAVVIVVAIVFGVFAARKPRELPYQVDESGVLIGEKTYPYASFKSFAVVQEGAVESIWLMPLKRFMPILTIYFAPTDKDKIVAVINDHLPVEDHQLDVVDRLMHKIRF